MTTTPSMPRGLLSLALLAVAAAPAFAAKGDAQVDIKYVHRDHVYVNAGRDSGLTPGTTADVLRKGKRVARVRFESVSGKHASAVFVSRERLPKTGDVVRFKPVPLPPTPPVVKRLVAQPVAAAAPDNAPRSFTPFGYQGHGVVQRKGTRAQAFLRSQGFVALDGRTVAATTRQRLWIRLDAALDPQERLRVAVDAHLVGQQFRPGDTRFEPYAVVWMELQEAALSWRSEKGLEIAVGRRPSLGLRYGLVDGVFVAWQLPVVSSTLRLAVGQRPHTTRLTFALNRPTATLGLDGAYQWRWGSASYAAGAAWLGRNYLSTEAGEASARATLELAQLLWLDADVAAVAWLPTTSLVPRGAVDRLGVMASTRQGPFSLRGSARRLNNAPLPSDVVLLPAGYLPGMPFYDVGLGADVTLPGRYGVGLGLSGGAMWDESHLQDRVYVSPEARVRLMEYSGLLLRGAVRTELGPTTSQTLDVGVSAQPVAGFHVGTSQQLGTWLLWDRRDIMPFWAWGLTAEYRFLNVFSAGVRGRGIINLTPEPGAHAFNQDVRWVNRSFNNTALGTSVRESIPYAGQEPSLRRGGSGVEAVAWIGAVDR